MSDIAAQSGYDYSGRRNSSGATARQNTKDTLDDIEAQINAQQNAKKGVIANTKEKAAEAKDLVTEQVKNKVKQVIKKQVITVLVGLLANPIFWIVLLVIVLVIGGVLFVQKLQDETGVSFTNICQTIGEQNCLKTVLNQTGVGLKNSNP